WRSSCYYWFFLLAVLSPWVVRNRIITGRWILSTAFEENIARVAAVATQAELSELHVEPWTPTWEHLYDRLEAQVALQHGWLLSSGLQLNCTSTAGQQSVINQTAQKFVLHHYPHYLESHMKGVLKSLLDPGHRTWYKVFTGRSWSSTGVVTGIWSRVWWSIQRRAVGDALKVFIEQRITLIPPAARLLWWLLFEGRVGIWFLLTRALYKLRQHTWITVLISAVILYTILLPGPIAHDRFYLPAIPVVTSLLVVGLLRKDPEQLS
ncbi:MAG: hypothetical protein P1S60_09230, partial [Anaerolineae bacterium]|nr:hypothetical protein [Anaerolineae bacterium]